mmetsp:Transcript_12958/g.32621  ORF Transcript_12958/g.32621 Transcript_12958/m.32621 type:complete len:87 (-) Transcript_12958:527-787(-)
MQALISGVHQLLKVGFTTKSRSAHVCVLIHSFNCTFVHSSVSLYETSVSTLCTFVVNERSFTVSELMTYLGSLSSHSPGTDVSFLV